MTQQVFPEVQAATAALEKQISITEAEIAEMKDAMTGKKRFVRGLRKAISAVNPKPASQKKKAAAAVV